MKLTINDYQEFVRAGSSDRYDKQLSIIGLMGEVGELADVVKKETIYPEFAEKYGISVEEKFIDEAGDVLWQYVNTLNQYGVDVEDVMEYNVNKLNNRHGKQKTAEDGGKR